MNTYEVTWEELVRLIDQLPPGKIMTVILEASDG